MLHVKDDEQRSPGVVMPTTGEFELRRYTAHYDTLVIFNQRWVHLGSIRCESLQPAPPSQLLIANLTHGAAP